MPTTSDKCNQLNAVLPSKGPVVDGRNRAEETGTTSCNPLAREAPPESLGGAISAFESFPKGFMAEGRERHDQEPRSVFVPASSKELGKLP